MFLKVVKVLLKHFDILIGRVNFSPAHCYLMLLAVSVNVFPEYECLMVLYSDHYVFFKINKLFKPLKPFIEVFLLCK